MIEKDKTELRIKVDNQIEQIRSEIAEISASELYSIMEEGENLVLIDVREESEFNAGHIEGAINVPRGLLEWYLADNFKNPEILLVFYCRTGARSALATKAAADIGFSNVRNVSGSIKEWMEAGYEVFNSIGSFKLNPGGFEQKDR